MKRLLNFAVQQRRIKTNQPDASVESPDGMIHLILASEEQFDGRSVVIKDGDGGGKERYNTAEELNRNSRKKQGG